MTSHLVEAQHLVEEPADVGAAVRVEEVGRQRHGDVVEARVARRVVGVGHQARTSGDHHHLAGDAAVGQALEGVGDAVEA